MTHSSNMRTVVGWISSNHELSPRVGFHRFHSVGIGQTYGLLNTTEFVGLPLSAEPDT